MSKEINIDCNTDTNIYCAFCGQLVYALKWIEHRERCREAHVLNQKIQSKVKTQFQIETLKQNWANDPIWDIENTEGYENYYNELLAFRLEKEAEWRDEQEKKMKPEGQLNTIRNIIQHAEDDNDSDRNQIATAWALIVISRCLAYFVEKDIKGEK